MAVRIRKDAKTIICAAKSKPEKGDVYLDDRITYMLAVEMRVLTVYDHAPNGADLWEFHKSKEKWQKKEYTKPIIVQTGFLVLIVGKKKEQPNQSVA